MTQEPLENHELKIETPSGYKVAAIGKPAVIAFVVIACFFGSLLALGITSPW